MCFVRILVVLAADCEDQQTIFVLSIPKFKEQNFKAHKKRETGQFSDTVPGHRRGLVFPCEQGDGVENRFPESVFCAKS